MSEQVSQYFGAQELVNPNLEPAFALEVNVAEGVLNFARVKSKFGTDQCHSASAKQKTAHFWRTHGVGNQARNFVGDELNRIFVVDAPVNPFLIIDVRKQMQDRSLNICRRRVIFDPFAIDAAQLLIRNMKDERMIWPQSLVLHNQVLRHHPISIAAENDRLDLIRRTHSQNARYPL